MSEKDISTEQIILEAAEYEFLEKGMAGAKTTSIAKRAGVTHAMLHYYFRTKANLFDMVFQSKIQQLAQSVSSSFDPNIPFFDQLRLAVERHFDFVARDPRLLIFIFSEIMRDEERKKSLFEKIHPRLESLIGNMKQGLDAEHRKGTIVDINPVDLLLNIISLNIITFLAQPLFVLFEKTNIDFALKLAERKESNVQFIINGVKKK